MRLDTLPELADFTVMPVPSEAAMAALTSVMKEEVQKLLPSVFRDVVDRVVREEIAKRDIDAMIHARLDENLSGSARDSLIRAITITRKGK